MGDILSAIADDIREYERRCKKYGEEVQIIRSGWGEPSPDCYGVHAEELKRRERREV